MCAVNAHTAFLSLHNMNIIGSPDISILDFLVAFDISGATPKIHVTNNSTGARLNLCNWWYVATTPSNTPIHTGVQTSPDKAGVWAPFDVPNVWPLFDTQIEYSDGNPYSFTLFVVDSANNVYSLRKTALITRPNGLTCKSRGNFGAANISVQVVCNSAVVKGIDTTNYAYQDQIAPSSSTNQWLLSYPMDSGGNIPDNYVANNTPNVMMPVGYSGKGYQIYFGTIATYTLADGVTVIIQYKFRNDFGVYCNIDLCPLTNQIQGLYNQMSDRCGVTIDGDIKDKLIRIGALLDLVHNGISQPLCSNIDVPGLIEQIKRIGGFDCDCYCSTGINAINVLPAPNTGGGCCPYSVSVIDSVTNQVPANCPNSYFPANVLKPDGTTVIGTAYNSNDVVSIVNADADWQAFGIAFAQGNCKIGWFLNNASVIPPNIKVTLIADVTSSGGSGGSGGGGIFQNNIYAQGTLAPPAACPASFYPAQVYNVSDTAVIGVANSILELIAIINADSGWNAYGKAIVSSSLCAFDINLNDANNLPPNVFVMPLAVTTGLSTVNKKVVTHGTSTAPALCPASFYPAKIYNSTGTSIIGIADNITDTVSLLNVDSGWHAYGTATAIDNCNVKWTLTNPTNIPPDIQVDVVVTGTGCVNNAQNYVVQVNDLCVSSTTITTSSFPLNVYVDFGTGPISVGNFTSQAAMVAGLNGVAGKPVAITFIAGAAVNLVIINNTDCASFNHAVTITTDIGSSNFVLYGANHSNLTGATPTKNGNFGMSLVNDSVLGHTFTDVLNQVRFQTIKLSGNKSISLESSTGIVYFYDNTIPLKPVSYTQVQLNTVVSGTNGNFTGMPQSPYRPGSSSSPSLYSLYCPTDYFGSGMFEGQVFIFEATTGTGWQIASTGVIHSFHDDKLKGKCPRVLLNNTLYFTQDGNLETSVGSSGVASGAIVKLDVTNFSSGGLSIQSVDPPASENVWAATYDGSKNLIYFIGEHTTVWVYNPLISTVIAIHANVLGLAAVFQQRVNAVYYGGKIYLTPVKMLGFVIPVIDVSSFATGIEFTTSVPAKFNQYSLYNLLPLGNCLAILTYNFTDATSGVNQGGLAIYNINTGKYLASIDMQGVIDIYNVIYYPNQPLVSPVGLIP